MTPEWGRFQHFGGAEIAPALLHGKRRRYRHLAGRRCPQQQRDEHHHDALSQPEPKECGFALPTEPPEMTPAPMPPIAVPT
jgi:hypothetical protein